MSEYRIVETRLRGGYTHFHVDKKFLRLFWRCLAVEYENSSVENLPKSYDTYDEAVTALREYINEPRHVIRLYHEIEV